MRRFSSSGQFGVVVVALVSLFGLLDPF